MMYLTSMQTLLDIRRIYALMRRPRSDRVTDGRQGVQVRSGRTQRAPQEPALASSAILPFCCIFVADCCTISTVDLSSCFIWSRVFAVLSAVALASVRATLSASLRLRRSVECCVFSTNVNAPRMMSPTMSAGRGCWRCARSATAPRGGKRWGW